MPFGALNGDKFVGHAVAREARVGQAAHLAVTASLRHRDRLYIVSVLGGRSAGQALWPHATDSQCDSMIAACIV